MGNNEGFSAEDIAVRTAAWNEWKEVCAVERCKGERHAEVLSRSICKAFLRKARRIMGAGFRMVGAGDGRSVQQDEEALCVQIFDGAILEKAEIPRFHRVTGLELPKKMYKQEIWRAAEESNDPFLEVICGKLTGPKGIINDIVVNYLKEEYGLRSEKGHHFVCDRSLNETIEGKDGSRMTYEELLAAPDVPGKLRDWEREKLRVEMTKRLNEEEMALVLAKYMEVSFDSPELMAFLNMGKSQMYVHYKSLEKKLRRLIEENGDAEERREIIELLLEICLETLRQTRQGERLLTFFEKN